MTLLVDTVCSFVAESILSEDCLKELHCNDAVDLHLFHIDLHRGSLFSSAFNDFICFSNLKFNPKYSPYGP